MQKVSKVVAGVLTLSLLITNKVLSGTPRLIGKASNLRINLKDAKVEKGITMDSRDKVDTSFITENLGAYFAEDGFDVENGDKVVDVKVKQGKGEITVTCEVAWGTTDTVTVV